MAIRGTLNRESPDHQVSPDGGSIIHGKVLVYETGEPLSELIVSAYDLGRLQMPTGKDADDFARQVCHEGRLLGTAVTNGAGAFELVSDAAHSPVALVVTAGHDAVDTCGVARPIVIAALGDVTPAAASQSAVIVHVRSELLGSVPPAMRPQRPPRLFEPGLDRPVTTSEREARLKRRVRGVVIPTSPDRLELEEYALTGNRLAIYADARHAGGTDPDKSVSGVMRTVLGTTQAALRAATERLLESSDSTDATIDGRSPLIGRSLAVNVDASLMSRLAPARSGNVDDRVVPFADVRRILPQLRLLAPESPARQIALRLGADVADLGSQATPPSIDAGPGSPPPALDDEDDRATLLRARLRQRLFTGPAADRLDPRSEAPYESTEGTNFPHHGGAADAVAVHDFHDLKLALPEVWAEALDTRIPFLDAVPSFVENLIPTTLTLEDWQRILVNLHRLGMEWSDLARAGAEYDVYDLMARGERPPAALVDAAGRGPAFEDWVASNPQPGPWGGPPPEVYRRMQDLQQQWIENVEALLALQPEVGALEAMAVDAGYGFGIFAPGSVNFGLLVTYRQEWTPLTYQVGDLVKTLPLAPKESRKYTQRTKIVKKRSRREVERSIATRRSEDATGTKATAEAVQRASEKTNFGMSATGTVEIMEIANVGGSQSFNTEAGRDSAETKRKFREAVSKAARELKDERRVEISTELSDESQFDSVNEISNPNEEITVTYLFYELQRRYRVAERLHSVQPVVLVANDVPAPEMIDEAWIVRHDWILRRALLDDSFRPALEYALEGRDAMNDRVDALREKKDELVAIVATVTGRLAAEEAAVALGEQEARMYGQMIAALTSQSDGVVGDVWEWTFGGAEGPQISGMEARLEHTQERLDRGSQRLKGLSDELAMHRNALDRAVDAYNKAVEERARAARHVGRLVGHIRDNILHYLHAKWSHEPPDQRFARLFDARVLVTGYPGDDEEVRVRVKTADGTLDGIGPGTPVEIVLPPPGEIEQRRLIELANLDELIGFKGNYMLFPLRQPTYLTTYMMQSYIGGAIEDAATLADATSEVPFGRAEGAATLVARDPDPASITSVQIAALSEHLEGWGLLTTELETTLDAMLRRRLLEPAGEPSEIVVATDSLYIEALPGTHPILEDFKLRHRALDVERVNLENTRMEMRLWDLEFDDPEIDKVIRVDRVGD